MSKGIKWKCPKQLLDFVKGRWDKIPTLADFFKAPLNYYAHNAAIHMYSMHTTVIKVTCSVLHIDLVPVWLSAVNSDLPRVMDIWFTD